MPLDNRILAQELLRSLRGDGADRGALLQDATDRGLRLSPVGLSPGGGDVLATPGGGPQLRSFSGGFGGSGGGIGDATDPVNRGGIVDSRIDQSIGGFGMLGSVPGFFGGPLFGGISAIAAALGGPFGVIGGQPYTV